MTYDREQLEKTLPPLRLPESSADGRAFDRELDARLSALAELSGCSAVQCVALAMWLGSRPKKEGPWSAFEIDMTDCAVDQNDPKFSRNMLLAGVSYDEHGEATSPTAAAKLAHQILQQDGYFMIEPQSLRVDIYNFRKERGPETRSHELAYLYKKGERQARLLEELKRSGGRLTVL